MVATIDESDADLVLNFRWSASRCDQRAERYYAIGSVAQRTIYMHRIIMGEPIGLTVDHINGDGLDNRRCNLRIATRSQNNANRSTSPASSGFRGVYTERNRQRPIRYRAQVGKKPDLFRGPMRKTPIEAAHDYDAEALRRFGEFARLNFPSEQSS
jgi:hypothetical protein